MKIFVKYSGMLVLVFILILPSCSEFKEFEFEPLAFPFAEPGDIERLAAFGIPNWSGTEPHNGIDLIIYESLEKTRILTPTNGTVTGIEMSENPFSTPPNQLLLKITITVNSEWKICLVLEPGTVNAVTKSLQRNAVYVEEDQEVSVGQHVADLLVGEQGYPHLHYMVEKDDEAVCAYLHSSIPARQVFINIVLTRAGNNMPDGCICYGQGY